MSIIEKAVEKLGSNSVEKKPATVATPPAVERSATETATTRAANTSVQKSLSEPVPEVSKATAPAAEQTAPVSPVRPARDAVQIPFDDLAAKGMLTPYTPRSLIAEEYRTIKRPLLRNMSAGNSTVADHPNLIMVTSALQGDGKTFTAVNLAISIAMEQDKTVLFIDADVAKASAGRLLGVDDKAPGLIDLLENKGVTPADVILPTNIENLRIIPAGNAHERSTELLASSSMHALMLELSGRYPDRVIVFDSPPLLLTTEASVLASFMGQIAIVVGTDETPQAAVLEALEHIGEDKVIGTILNKAHRRRNKLLGISYGTYGGQYGYGGYGYGYGYGHRHAQAATDQPEGE